MKTMTCLQLGGACDVVFRAETFGEIAKKSQAHGKDMYAKGDAAHLAAMEKMSEMMQNPEDMQAWMDGKEAEFAALPEAN